MINTLVYTNLYPNTVQARHGIFVEQRLRHLVESGSVSASVMAPVPWFPIFGACWKQYRELGGVSEHEARFGIDVFHPRFPIVPRFSSWLNPVSMAMATYNQVNRHLSANKVDLIDAHFFYPDGVAAALIGARTRKPVVITARGTDLNLMPRYPIPRKWIIWAANRAAAIITVCQALKDVLIELGIPEGKVTVLRNGVDLEMFRPVDRGLARERLRITRPSLLSVGHLIERKGHHLVIEALANLPDVGLIIAGDGPMEPELRATALAAGVQDRVTFAGALDHKELREYYSAADALVLASSREGMANVLLESIACGTPVIATPAWGTPEVVAESAAGVLTEDRSARGIVAAYHRLVSNYPTQAATRAYAEQFSWDSTTQGQIQIFSEITAANAMLEAG